MLSEVAFRAPYPGYYNLYADWANVSLFLILLIYGYVAAAEERIVEAMYRERKLALAIALLITSALLVRLWIEGRPLRPAFHQPLYYVYYAGSALNSWCWIVAFIGTTCRRFERGTRMLAYASHASFPFYVLHQTVLVGIAFYVTRLDLDVWLKFGLIALPTFFVTVLAVELFKLTPVTRFMLGIKKV